MRRQRGLTLIELLVVLAVIAMMVMLAAPRFGAMAPGLELRESAEALRADIRRARNAAVRENRETVVLIDAEAGLWTGGRGLDGTLPEGTAVSLLTARQEQESDSAGGIRFYPDGTSTGGTLTLSRGTRALVLSVDWFDGHVAIDETDAR